MAGIAGIKGTEGDELSTMLERIKHRGPHEKWTSSEAHVNLGCCELNVGGNARQGAHHVTERKKAVVLDGRVYNSDKGTMTDAEVVLEYYKKYGKQFASRLDGDFAFAISDNGELLLGRDAVGVKPLYYGHSNGKLLFASEAKALVGLVSDVQEFPSGYVYSEELGFQNFYKADVETPEFENYDQAKKVLADLLQEAVDRRIADNAPGGVLLSGGLDSSLITYMVHKRKPDVEAFTVSMEAGQDLPLAKDVTKYLDIKHHVLIFDENDVNEVLDKAVHYQEMYEESCIHGAIANYIGARFLSQHTNCVLTGEGADEFLFGYDGQFRPGRNPEEIASIVDKLIRVAHNTALQRLDRLAAANSVETRTPFTDSRVVDFCAKIPLEHKIHPKDDLLVGKWILRQAFEGGLPDHLIYQTKRFFAQGSGVASIMRAQAEKHVSEAELEEHNKTPGKPHLESVEELYYYRKFKQTFADDVFDPLVGRWDPWRPDFFLR